MKFNSGMFEILKTPILQSFKTCYPLLLIVLYILFLLLDIKLIESRHKIVSQQKFQKL